MLEEYIVDGGSHLVSCHKVKEELASRCIQPRIVMEEEGEKIPVVVHVGAMSTQASIEMAKHAERFDAAGVSSVPPFYFNYNGEQIYQYYKDVAESTSLPMIVYNIPLAGMMTVGQIICLSQIENVKGVKYTGTALYEVTQIKEGCEEGFLVYGSYDELGSSSISLGMDDIISSFYNVIADHYIKIWNAVKASDIPLATQLQHEGQVENCRNPPVAGLAVPSPTFLRGRRKGPGCKTGGH